MNILKTDIRPPRAAFALALLLCLAFAQFNSIAQYTEGALNVHRQTLENIREERYSRPPVGMTSAIYYEAANRLAAGFEFDSKTKDRESMELLYQLLDKAHTNQVPSLSHHSYWALNSLLDSEAEIALEKSAILDLQRIYLYRTRVVRAELRNWKTPNIDGKLYTVKRLRDSLEVLRDFLTPELVQELRLVQNDLDAAFLLAYDLDRQNALDVYDDPGAFITGERSTETSEEFGYKAALVSFSGIDILRDNQVLEFLDRNLSDRVRLITKQSLKSEYWELRVQKSIEIDRVIENFLSTQKPVQLP